VSVGRVEWYVIVGIAWTLAEAAVVVGSSEAEVEGKV
jgi:hypothetical protein